MGNSHEETNIKLAKHLPEIKSNVASLMRIIREENVMGDHEFINGAMELNALVIKLEKITGERIA